MGCLSGSNRVAVSSPALATACQLTDMAAATLAASGVRARSEAEARQAFCKCCLRSPRRSLRVEGGRDLRICLMMLGNHCAALPMRGNPISRDQCAVNIDA